MKRFLPPLAVLLLLVTPAAGHADVHGLEGLSAAGQERTRSEAEQGVAIAQFFLGFYYHHGILDVPQDYAKAMKWYQLAAEQGNDSAQTNIGSFYYFGHGVPQDYGEAGKWFRLAAEQGNHTAQFSIGNMYENGDGVPQDYAEARQWYLLAAEQGEAYAQNRLGAMYYLGRGVPKNYVQSHIWLNLAVAGGHEPAIKGRDLVAQHMTPADISKAQRMAREWLEAHPQAR